MVMLQSRCAIYEGAKERQDYHDIFSSMGCRIRSLLHYVTTKAGLIGMTRSLAKELGEFNVNVNCVSYGSQLSEQLSRSRRRMRTFLEQFYFWLLN